LAAFGLSMGCFGACGTGSATIAGARITGQTHRQIVVQFSVPHANAAQVDVFTDAACTQETPDTSASNAANRAGSVIDGVVSTGSADGRSVEFPVGTLSGNRALTQATQYWVQIKNTADNSAVTIPASTNPMPLGNLYPEQPLPDATKWDNRAYPAFTWGTSHRNDKYTDPTTGLIVKPFTMPGDAWSQGGGVNDGVNNFPPFDTPITNSGSWTNPGNSASPYNVGSYPTAPGSGYSTCTGSCDIWLPIPTIPPPGGGDWGGGTPSAYGPRNGFDYFVPYVWASCSGCAPTMTVSLSQTPTGSAYHGCAFTTAALTNTNTGYRSPDPDPGFASLCTAPPLRGDIALSSGTVNTSGTTVTWVSGMYFQWSWPVGSYIKIGASFYQIASVNSATSITLQSSAGTQSGVAYVSRAMGVRIQANAGAGTLSLQAEYRIGVSPQFQVNEDSGQLHCSPNANTIGSDVNGNAYSGYTLQGYICWIQYDVNSSGAYYLVIPKDQNGAPLGEVRVIGTTTTNRTFTSNGVTFTNASFFYAGPDASTPNKWYVTYPYNNGKTSLLLSAKFDNSLTGCSVLWKTWQGAQTYPTHGNNTGQDSCISYTNLTNPSGTRPMDIASQIVRAYGALNPRFDLSGFALGTITYLDGYFGGCMAPGGNPQVEVCGTFDVTGTLTQVFDTFTTYPARWCAVHGPLHLTGTWHSVTCDFVPGPNPGTPLYGPFQFTPAKINLAGFGGFPNWTTNTTLDNGMVNQYACPTSAQMQSLGTSKSVADSLVVLGSNGNHCIEVETNSEACSAGPNTAAIWSQATKTEAQQFPCPTNPAYSMLQAIHPGDYFMDSALGPYGEGFTVLTKQITSPGGVCTGGTGNCVIDMWVIRGDGLWPNNLVQPYTVLRPHSAGWIAQMQALQLVGCTPFFADSTAVGSHTWIEGFFSLCLSHGSASKGTSGSNVNLAFIDTNNFLTFDVAYNMDQAQAVMPPWGTGCERCVSPAYPTFGGNKISLTNGNLIQQYGDAGDLVNPGQRTALFERHLNPAYGSGGETFAGMGAMGYTLTLVSGTSQTYTLTDPYSAGQANQKLTPIAGFAGAHMLADYSGRGSVLPDSGYGMCRALNAGECVSGSSVGTTYVSVPAAAGSTQGVVGQHTQNAPVVINPSSIVGQIEEVPYHKPDPDGSHQRLLGQALTGLGRQWQFNEPKYLPTGDWYLGTMVYRDGFATQVGLFQVPRYVEDTINRSGYVPVPIATGGASGDSVRVEFWYQEWNGVNGRAEHAFTTSGQTATSPFLWAYEPQAYTPCGSGCTVNVPAISSRLLYYTVHRRNGSMEATGPVHMTAVP
jgi:hypothetical protein